jgi:uncharacterized protein
MVNYRLRVFILNINLQAQKIDDITNFTNRSPYPTLHLIREDSIDDAVKAFPEAEAIFETNIQTMEKLGTDGWKKLFAKK